VRRYTRADLSTIFTEAREGERKLRYTGFWMRSKNDRTTCLEEGNVSDWKDVPSHILATSLSDDVLGLGCKPDCIINGSVDSEYSKCKNK
jgi:hypothetical protein